MMQLWLDTINLEMIKEVEECGILAGVTTNPKILGAADTIPEKKLEQLLTIQTGLVAAQVTANDLDGMVKQGEKLAALAPKRMIIKIPLTVIGLKAMRLLKEQNIATLATAVLEPSQVYLACLAQADYIAPYVGHIQNNVGNCYDILESMLSILKTNNFPSQLMAASISSKDQVIRCAEMGTHAITIPESVCLKLLETHSLTEASLESFNRAWSSGEHTQFSAFL